MRKLAALLVLILSISTRFVSSEEKLQVLASEFQESFYHEYQKYEQNHEITGALRELLKVPSRENLELKDLPESKNSELCLRCRAGVHTLIQKIASNQAVDQIRDTVISICTILDVYSLHACHGFANSLAPQFKYIFEKNPGITAERVCAIAFQSQNCGPKLEERKLLVKIDPGRPTLTSSKALHRTSSKPLTVVQLTDPHFDPHYVSGSNANCGSHACCNKWQGVPKRQEDAAGFWGDYRSCDTPLHAVNNTFRQVREQHKDIDFIYFTGDIVDHFTYQTSVASNSYSFSTVFSLMKEVFRETPVFPIFGNHEGHPANQFAPLDVPADLQSDWLYSLARKTWARWIPDADLGTVLKGGYYTTLVRPGLRVIALNSNIAIGENYWLFLDDEYFTEQLQWLHDTLLQAERAGEKVHILSHVPSNGGLYHKFSYNYALIVERFAETIAAQFNGHTHLDEFTLYFSSSNEDVALNVGWNGGSITSYIDVNPNYSVYEVDGGSFEVLDVSTWIYNLTEANDRGEPRWFQEYSFKEEFKVDMSPKSLFSLVGRFMEDRPLLRKYWTYKVKSADPFLKSGCEEKCLRQHVCEILQNDFSTHPFCKKDSEENAAFGEEKNLEKTGKLSEEF